jgi:hypothetical protein
MRNSIPVFDGIVLGVVFCTERSDAKRGEKKKGLAGRAEGKKENRVDFALTCLVIFKENKGT